MISRKKIILNKNNRGIFFPYSLKKTQQHNGILEEKLKVREHKFNKEIEKLNAKWHDEKQRAERYKEFYVRTKKMENNYAIEDQNGIQGADNDYDEITTADIIERPKRRSRNRTPRNPMAISPSEVEKVRVGGDRKEKPKTNVSRRGNKIRISNPIKPYRPENDYT